MKLIIRLLSLGLLGLLLVLVAGRGRSVSQSGSPAVATVGEQTITLADLEMRIETLPDQVRADMQDPGRQLDLLEHMTNELLLVLAAESAGLDRNADFRAILQDARRQMLSRYYRERMLRPRAVPDSAYVERYYAEHPEEFTVTERVTGRQIVLATEEEARQVRARLLAGESFDDLLDLSIDTTTSSLGGKIGVVSRGAPVRGLGRDEGYVEAVLALDAGEISEPIETKVGFHVVEVMSHDPERVRTLEMVRESLTRRLQPGLFRQVYETTLDSLRQVYAVDVHEQVVYGEERYRTEQAKELFERAQATTDARERLRIYQEILDLGVEERYAAQARFMRGFVYLEEMGDTARGRRELEQVITQYPESDLVDSARWMLDNSAKSAPPDSASARESASGGEDP